MAHLDLPKSIEAYYQKQVEQAEMDLNLMHTLYGAEDIVKLRQFIKNSEADKEQKVIEYKKLEDLLGLAEALIEEKFYSNILMNTQNGRNVITVITAWKLVKALMVL